MQRIKKVISALLVLSIVASFNVNSSAAGSTDEISFDKEFSPIIELFFEYDYDINQAFWYEDTMIPVGFDIMGLEKNQTCSLTVDSSLNITSVAERNVNNYDSLNNHATMEFSFDDTASVQRFDSDPAVDYIKITASSEQYRTIPCTLTMYVLNSSYGVFVSYIGEEHVRDFYYQWMFDNEIIGEAEYSAVLETKGLTTTIDEEAYFTAVNSAGTARSVLETKVYVEYNITKSGTNLVVAGTLTWSDINGKTHPLQQAKVEIVDDDVTVDDIVATTYTNTSGNFSVTFANQTGASENGGCDIFVRAYPQSSNITVTTILGGSYSLKTPVTMDVTGNVGTIYQVLNPCDTAKSFQIHQAAIVGAQYVKSLSGTTPANCNVRYPQSDSQSNSYKLSAIWINASTYYSWDVILHEYAHYIQDVYNTENNPADGHNPDSNLIDMYVSNGSSLSVAKDKGCRLAWGEGWATYFAVSAQIHQGIAGLGIPGAGDASFDDLYGNWFRNCETELGRGEGNEMAVTCVLWDLADSTSWNGSKTETHDSLSLGYQAVWNYTLGSGGTTLSNFVNYVYSKLSTTNYCSVGSILAKQNITADALRTNNSVSTNYYFSSDIAPTFSWTAAKGSVKCIDNYELQIYDTSLKPIYTISIASGATSYTLSDVIWKNLKTNYSGGFYWCVKTTPSATPATGPYFPQFIRCYLTNIL